MRFVPFVSLMVFLAACHPFNGPNFMPDGYEHHNKRYKSPPGGEASDIGYDYSAVENQAVLDVWADVIKTMVDDFESHVRLAEKEVFIRQHERPLDPKSGELKRAGQTPFFTTYDHMLRDEFRRRGYHLADHPQGVVNLIPKAKKVRQVDGTVVPGVLQDFVLILEVEREGLPLGELRGAAKLPEYGYDHYSMWDRDLNQ